MDISGVPTVETLVAQHLIKNCLDRPAHGRRLHPSAASVRRLPRPFAWSRSRSDRSEARLSYGGCLPPGRSRCARSTAGKP